MVIPKIKHLTVLITFFTILSSKAIAFEEVFLDTTEINKLQIPTSSTQILDAEKKHKENYTDINDYSLDDDEEVFTSNAGRKFSKFIDKAVINNKLNKKLSDYENRYLYNE